MPLLRSNDKELLLIHIPKCGGTSLERAFSHELKLSMLHDGPGDLPCSPQHFHANVLEDIFDFCIPPAVAVVRNPFDRLVSEYRYQLQHGLINNIEFEQFVNNSFGEYWKNSYVHDNHIRPQVEFITPDTVVFRMEEKGVTAAQSFIADYFGLQAESKVPRENMSRKSDFVVEPQTLSLINSFYARDFELLGYPEVGPGKKPRKHSSMSYSARPISDLMTSALIRRKVLHDQQLVTEAEGARMAAKLERAENEQKSAEEVAARIEQELNQLYIANEEITNKLDSRFASLEESFKITVTHLLEDAMASQSDSASRLQEVLKDSHENLSNDLSGIDKVVSLIKVVDELNKRVRQYQDETSNRSNALAAQIEKLISDRESRYTTILQSLTDLFSAHSSDLTVLLKANQDESRSTDQFLEAELTRIRSSSLGSARSFETVQKNLAQVLASIAKGFDIQQINQAKQGHELSAQIAGLAENIAGVDQILGTIKNDLITAFEESRNMMADSLSLEHHTWLLALASTKKIEGDTGSIIERLDSSATSQKALLLESVDELRQGIQRSLNENKDLLKRGIAGLDDRFELLEKGQENALLAVDRIIHELGSYAESQKEFLQEPVDGLRQGFQAGLNESKARLEQKIADLDDKFGLLEKGQESALLAADRIIHELGSSSAFQKELLLGSVDGLQRGLSDKLDSHATSVARKFEEIETRQESARLAGERQIVNQFRTLIEEIRQKEILDLRSTIEELNAQLASARSSELSLTSKLDEATTLEARHRRQLGTLNAKVSELEQQKDRLAQESISLTETISEMQRVEQELQHDLKDTVDRFHAEIEYRNSIHARNIDLESEVISLREQHRALLESTSFRITRPLRTLSTTLQILRPNKNRSSTTTAEILRLTAPRTTASHIGKPAVHSHLDIAIVVENLDRGGLEQVVLDHARYFSTHCRSLDLFVANETGQVYEQALQHGLNVLCIKKHNLNLEQYLVQKSYDFAFFHHSYGYLPAFRPATKLMVEVIHNEYSWQLNNEFYESIRSNNIDKFIAVSDPVRRYSIANLGIDEHSIVAIVNGLNVEGLIRPPIEILQQSRAATLHVSPTFIMCANGQPQKNHVLVIRAFLRLAKKHPGVKLLLAGNLSVDEDVEKAISAELKKFKNPDNIKLLGSLNRREMSRYLAAAHIALLPTKYEGFSIATLEYLYFGLPMILSNTGGAEYIAGKYGCVIVDNGIGSSPGAPSAGEVKSLARSMSKMIEEYSSFCEKSVVGASSYPDYTVDAVCNSYLVSDI